jgi:predicted O-methyltransferase YrrM
MSQPFPDAVSEIEVRAAALGFDMNSGWEVGRLLAALAASKPGGQMMELGTGCGLGAAWLLHGMDAGALLLTIDTDNGPQAIARDLLGGDGRVSFILEDGGAVLARTAPASFDLIFADAWPGKFSHLDEALEALKPGGFYVIDDLQPQPNWPDGHQANVDALLADLGARDGYAFAQMDWATGVAVLVRH